MKNKSPLRILSAVALLAFSGIGMVACNSGVTGEPPETTIEDTRAYNIWFDDELSANSSKSKKDPASCFGSIFLSPMEPMSSKPEQKTSKSISTLSKPSIMAISVSSSARLGLTARN